MNRHKKVEHEKKTLTENDENALKNLKNLSAEETVLKELWKNTFLIREKKNNSRIFRGLPCFENGSWN